jgi:hypothetical protein
VLRTLTSHVTARQPAQLVMDQRHEPVECTGVSAAPSHQQLGRAFNLV